MATPKKPKELKPAFQPVNIYDVLVVTKDRKIYLGGTLITEKEVQNLQQEIKALESFKIWGVFQETIKQKAIEKGLNLATTWEETLSAKMMLHNLGIMRSITTALIKLGSYQQTPKK